MTLRVSFLFLLLLLLLLHFERTQQGKAIQLLYEPEMIRVSRATLWKQGLFDIRVLFALLAVALSATTCGIPLAQAFIASSSYCTTAFGMATTATPILIPRRSRRLESVNNNTKKQKASTMATTSNSALENDAGSLLHEEDQSSRLLARIGVLADIQYAPIPDGYSYSGNPRFYQHALHVANHAAEHFEREKVDLVVNLGDIVDGKCQSISTNGGVPLPSSDEDGRTAGEQCVDHVMDALSRYKHGQILHTYGNHCLYNMDRPMIQRKLNIPFVQEPCGDLVGYYSHQLCDGVRLVVLDTYDIALMQRCQRNSKKRQEAVRIMTAKNPNYPQLENSPDGLKGMAQRFVAFNGAVGRLQLQWLQQTLEEARRRSEMVIILSHQPILPGSSKPVCLVWNYNDVLRILRQYRDVVVASLAGHAHKGGYRRDDKSGIHFRVIEAVLESPSPHLTYAVMSIYRDRLHVQGYGNCGSAVYELDHNQYEQSDRQYDDEEEEEEEEEPVKNESNSNTTSKESAVDEPAADGNAVAGCSN